MTPSKKIKLLYSKKQINSAWISLIKDNLSENEMKENLLILNNWRTAHDYPMNTFQSLLRSKIKSLQYSAVVVERLKRTHSIIGKLKRNPNMMLSRIQDIGGLRVVLENIDEVYKLRDALLKGRFLHELVKENDYIRKPKDSWYRSLHMVYKYQNSYVSEYNGLQIEIQIRTELQHIRATAVETVGIILQKALKAWEWTQEWLDFFALTSSLFAIKEGCVPTRKYQWKDLESLKKTLKALEKKLHVIDKLKTYSNEIKQIDTNLGKRYEHYLLILNLQDHTIKVLWFKSWELDKATELYLQQEQLFKTEDEGQVVLVAGESLKTLSHAYPNYFGDTAKFISLLQEILD